MTGGAQRQRFLGIDLGTGSAKAAVTDDTGRLLAVAACGYDVRTDRPGWAETDPDRWWSAVVTAVRAVLADPVAAGPVSGIGLSGQMHGVVLTGADGTPLRPAILHADTRATDELDAFRQIPEVVAQWLANPFAPGMAGPILCWLARHEAPTLAAARWALQPKDWLRMRLVGQAATEPSDASATLLYDVPADCWYAEVIEALGIDPDLLAPLLPSSGALAGSLTGAAADALGLTAGIPVAAGGGDTAVAALGTGLVEPGPVQLTVGSSAQVVTILGAAVSLPGVHVYRTATPVDLENASPWYALGAVLNAGLALNWARTLLRASWDELHAAAQRPATADDPIFLPHLTGERTPYQDPSMRGAWTGLSLATDRDALLRSALEGVAFAIRAALDAVFVADPDAPLRLAGGGSTNPAWRQLLANVLGRPLTPYLVSSASARGAALLGGIASGALTWGDIGSAGAADAAAGAVATLPEPGAVDRYDARRAAYAGRVDALRHARS